MGWGEELELDVGWDIDQEPITNLSPEEYKRLAAAFEMMKPRTGYLSSSQLKRLEVWDEFLKAHSEELFVAREVATRK